ncbi:MAG: cell division protein FtsQ/DivIB [Acidobacteriota bacterium]
MALDRFSEELVPAERFLRGRGRRAPRLRAQTWLGRSAVLAGLVTAAFWTVAVAGRVPELTVNHIRVEGNRRLAEGEILEALELHRETNILTLDLEALKQRLLRSVWVKDVELTRVLPATLTLRVIERKPVGIAVADRLYLIDGEGIFLDEVGPHHASLALPLVRGVERPPDADGMAPAIEPERAGLAGRVLAAMEGDKKLKAAISEIDVSQGADSLLVRLRYPPLALLAAERDLVPRLKEILPLTEAILGRFPSVRAVDLRFKGRVYLKLGASHPEDTVEAVEAYGAAGETPFSSPPEGR